MKLKSTLWTLAVALVVVSCSDELGNDPLNPEGVDGPTTYMKVNINTETITRAPQGDDGKPTGGEDGDGLETGSENEYKVNDVTVVLFRNAGNVSPVSAINANSDLIAAGYSSEVKGMDDSNEPQHSKMATVTLSVTDEVENFDGKTYGVIAITNIGSDELKELIGDQIKNGQDLAGYLQRSVYKESNGTASNFIMSSHLPNAETVTLRAGTSPDNAPEVNIHVERLAAKIRINEYKADGTNGNNFIYTIEEGTGTSKNAVAKVRLEQVAIVNQLTSGTYLLKHMSASENQPTTDSEYSEIPDVANDTYLADEVWSASSANYVIDPWTRNKTTDNVNNISSIDDPKGNALLYANPFAGDNYGNMWSSLKGAVSLCATSGTAAKSPIHLAYVQENTTSAKASLNGYSTGAIFKATYVPAKITTINAKGDAVEPNPNVTNYASFGASTSAKDVPTFYVYNNVAYNELETIFAGHVWKYQTEAEDREKVDYSSFNATNIAKLSKDDFMKSKVAISDDPFGYLAYLKGKAGDATDGSWTGTFATGDDFATYLTKDDCKAAIKETIKKYTNGECYYPYWIRHANNDKANVMGIMEFGIVRNNIYDLTIEGISGFGLSSTDVPDPDTPDEEKNYYLKVNLFVRDWVVRSNSGIIL